MEKAQRNLELKDVILVNESEWTQLSVNALAQATGKLVIAVPDINNLKSLSKDQINVMLTAILHEK